MTVARLVRIGRWAFGFHFTPRRWLHLIAARPVGPGVVAFTVIAGADQDVPLRPWPQLWFEVRPNGSHLTAIVWCGLGLQIQTTAR